MEQKDKAWVVNANEAINRTCNAIFEEYKETIMFILMVNLQTVLILI